MKHTTRRFNSASPPARKNSGAATQKFVISLAIAAAVLGQFCFAGQFIENVTVTESDCHLFFSQELRPLAAGERNIIEVIENATNVFDFASRLFPDYPRILYLLISNRCPLGGLCKNCYMLDVMESRAPKDMDINLIRSIADQVSGLDEVYLSGGEPFFYMKTDRKIAMPSEEFWIALAYLSKRVRKITINTNGYLFLDREAGERIVRRLKQLGNVELVVSVDIDHDRALKARFGSEGGDKNIVDGIRYIKGKLGADGAVPVFFSRRWVHDIKPDDFLREIGLLDRTEPLVHDTKEIVNLATFRLGGAIREDGTYARGVTTKNLLFSELPYENFMFIGTDGRLFINSYASAMKSPPAFTLAGDLTRDSVTEIMINSWVRRFLKSDRFEYLTLIFLSQYFRMSGNERQAQRYWEEAETMYRANKDLDDHKAFKWLYDVGYDRMCISFLRTLYYEMVFVYYDEEAVKSRFEQIRASREPVLGGDTPAYISSEVRIGVAEKGKFSHPVAGPWDVWKDADGIYGRILGDLNWCFTLLGYHRKPKLYACKVEAADLMTADGSWPWTSFTQGDVEATNHSELWSKMKKEIVSRRGKREEGEIGDVSQGAISQLEASI